MQNVHEVKNDAQVQTVQPNYCHFKWQKAFVDFFCYSCGSLAPSLAHTNHNIRVLSIVILHFYLTLLAYGWVCFFFLFSTSALSSFFSFILFRLSKCMKAARKCFNGFAA